MIYLLYSLYSLEKIVKQKELTAPKILTSGVNISLWNKLIKIEKATALSKSWFCML